MAKYIEVSEVPSEDFPGRSDVLSVYSGLVARGVCGFRLYFHPESPVTSTASHLDVYGGTEAEILKCLVIADSKNAESPVCCLLMSCEYRWDRQKVKELTGFRDPTFATEEQLFRWTRRRGGGLDPFSIPSNIRCWIERRLLDKAWVIGSGGSPVVGLGVAPSEILRISQFPVVDAGRIEG